MAQSLLERAVRVFKEEGLFDFLKKSLRLILTPFILFYLIFRIKFLKSSKENLINGSFSGLIGGWYGKLKPSQVKYEISELLNYYEGLKPKNILEIGTHNGGTLMLFTKLAEKNAKIISVDLPGGGFGGGYSPIRVPLYRSFVGKGQEVHLLRLNSHENETKLRVKDVLNGDQLDFLFIDGDHSYQGVKQDFDLYFPLVREGGIIALHDVAPHKKESGCEVDRFWNEIKDNFSTKEIIENKNQGWAGIGIIKK